MHATNSTNRRRFERFALRPMYTPVAVRLMDNEHFTLEGHAYDISEGGIRFELDHPIAPGTPIAMQITLPTNQGDIGPGRSVFVMGNVVWIDDSEPGPVQMALVITRFVRLGDRERLLKRLASGTYARAA
ncbi:MAG: PilZ domain-containing protein [Phycisphaerales bacterium]|nr:PilZ domain-containing protein [Phycisphaerales bacterium]